MIYMFLSNNPSSGDINSSNLSCLHFSDQPLPATPDYISTPRDIIEVMQGCGISQVLYLPRDK